MIFPFDVFKRWSDPQRLQLLHYIVKRLTDKIGVFFFSLSFFRSVLYAFHSSAGEKTIFKNEFVWRFYNDIIIIIIREQRSYNITSTHAAAAADDTWQITKYPIPRCKNAHAHTAKNAALKYIIISTTGRVVIIVIPTTTTTTFNTGTYLLIRLYYILKCNTARRSRSTDLRRSRVVAAGRIENLPSRSCADNVVAGRFDFTGDPCYCPASETDTKSRCVHWVFRPNYRSKPPGGSGPSEPIGSSTRKNTRPL